MTTRIPFGTRLIGQTEKTLNAVLDHLLNGSGINEPEWVGLTVTIHGGAASYATAAQRIATALRVAPDIGGQVIASLIGHGFVQVTNDEVGASAAGRAFHENVQGKVRSITDRLWSDIPADQQQTAAVVLNTTLERAALELNRLGNPSASAT